MAASPALCLGPQSHPPCPLLSLVGTQSPSLAKTMAKLRDRPMGVAWELLRIMSDITVLMTPEYLGRGCGEEQSQRGSWKQRGAATLWFYSSLLSVSISLQELGPFSSLSVSVLSWPLFPPLFALAESTLIP